jgi:hypothetical protein
MYFSRWVSISKWTGQMKTTSKWLSLWRKCTEFSSSKVSLKMRDLRIPLWHLMIWPRNSRISKNAIRVPANIILNLKNWRPLNRKNSIYRNLQMVKITKLRRPQLYSLNQSLVQLLKNRDLSVMLVHRLSNMRVVNLTLLRILLMSKDLHWISTIQMHLRSTWTMRTQWKLRGWWKKRRRKKKRIKLNCHSSSTRTFIPIRTTSNNLILKRSSVSSMVRTVKCTRMSLLLIQWIYQ